MATTSNRIHTRTITYDVFLSFRGKDTRHTFTDYLYKALLRANLRTFRDDNAIPRGEVLTPKIKTAISESRSSIVVLSENYADSRWCLEELWLILNQRRNFNHFVLPVFYHVDPSDVRHQTGSFAIQRSRTVDEEKRWKEALTMVGNMTGEVLSRYETDFIEKVVQTVITKLDLKMLSTPMHLTGMETRIEGINSWLKNEQYNVIAICGMGGIGKTTLAQCIYNSNKHDFECNSFVEKIGENYKHGLCRLQKQLLRDVSGNEKVKISNALEGTSKIEDTLQTKKVLIVLDDINDQEELSTLLGTKAFHTQTKIIITTRLLDIDAWFVSRSSRCMVHKLKNLDVHESLELFSWYAFGSKLPVEGFGELAQQLATYCGGNPLALKVLGSSLFVSDEDPRKRNNMIEIWRDRVISLNSSKGDLDCKLQDVLRKSFDSLQFDNHKELFLDIACFFVGERKDMLTIWRDDLHVKYGIMTLITRCLLTISPDTNELVMHQLLQDMGRKIVCEESKDPSKRSRVWHDDESYCVLRKGDGSNTIEGLALDMQKLGQGRGSEPVALKTSSLSNMNKLKLLRLKYVKLTGSYKNFPELRWLCWHGCPLETMRPGLLQSSLVVIDMSHGHIETFEAPTVLNVLKILNLEGCVKLVSISELRRLPKLESLILSSCSTLTHLSESIEDLESLALLDLKGCFQLLKASSNMKNVKSRPKRPRIDIENSEQSLFSLPCSLKSLHLSECKIECNNDVRVSFHTESFFKLCLERNPFEFLPNSIDLKMLKTLNLNSCNLLKSLTCIPSTLEELYVDQCYSLEKITFQSARFSLQQFSYEDCSELSEVQGLFKLVSIAKMDEADLVQHMQWIKGCEGREVDLVGDDITKGRDREIRMLYEYGIMSTYLQDIKDQNMMTYEHKSPFPNFSFHVPLHQKKHTIQGLHVSCLYRSSRSKDKDMWLFLAKISNKTKGVTWIYNPMVYCEPRVDEDVVWLSYWPIGNKLDAGDEVSVDIIADEGVIASECGASLKCVDGELENCENNTLQGEEVIGGDLSEFKVTTEGYYLCRRNLFGSETSSYLKELFDVNVDYPESEGWRKTRHSRM